MFSCHVAHYDGRKWKVAHHESVFIHITHGKWTCMSLPAGMALQKTSWSFPDSSWQQSGGVLMDMLPFPVLQQHQLFSMQKTQCRKTILCCVVVIEGYQYHLVCLTFHSWQAQLHHCHQLWPTVSLWQNVAFHVQKVGQACSNTSNGQNFLKATTVALALFKAVVPNHFAETTDSCQVALRAVGKD